MTMRRLMMALVARAWLGGDAMPAAARSCRAPAVVADTVLTMKYCSDPAFNDVIDDAAA
jgi:hypothetical protein